MFKALVLVRNFESRVSPVDFGEFAIRLVGANFTKLRDYLSSTDVNQDDWILRKTIQRRRRGRPVLRLGISRLTLKIFSCFSACSGPVTYPL